MSNPVSPSALVYRIKPAVLDRSAPARLGYTVYQVFTEIEPATLKHRFGVLRKRVEREVFVANTLTEDEAEALVFHLDSGIREITF